MSTYKEGFCESAKGKPIDNLPTNVYPKGLELTGYWKTDFYGCWWWVKDLDNGGRFLMIGDYPDDYFKESEAKQ